MHLTRPDGKAGRREAGICQHRGKLVDGDVVEHNGLLVTSPTRAALEYTTLTDVEHSLVEIDYLLHRNRWSTLVGLRAALRLDDPVAGHPDHRPGAASG